MVERREDFGNQDQVRALEDVNMNHYECGNLFGVCKRLLEGSGLVRYSGDSFVCNSDEESLEACWRENFDQDFGRNMAWVWFSVGAETWSKLPSSVVGSWSRSRRDTATHSIGGTRTKGNGSQGSTIAARPRGEGMECWGTFGK